MKKILTILMMLITSLTINAQYYIYKGDNQYEATSTWQFSSNNNFGGFYPDLTIAKHSNGGYLMLSVSVPIRQYYIRGTVFTFLSDGSVIKCIDKKIKDYVDGHSIALYDITVDEIEKLKNNRIIKIRYSIYDGGLEESTSYTADNKKRLYSPFIDPNSKSYYETDLEIRELFNKN